MNNIILNESVYFSNTFNHPYSGFNVNADSTPQFYVFEQDSDTPLITSNLTSRTSFPGLYRGTFDVTASNGFEIGKFYDIIVSGTVGGVSSLFCKDTFSIIVSGLTASEVWDNNTRSLTTEVDANVTNWRGSQPSTLSAGNVQANAAAMSPGVITATVLHAGAAEEIADAVWDELRSDHQIDGSFGQFVFSSGVFATSGSSISAADVWGYGSRTLTNADVVWHYLTADADTIGSFGVLVNTNLNTTVSSRATDAGVWTNGTRTLTSAVSVSGGIVNTLTNPVSTSGGDINLVTTTTNVTNTVGANLLTWLGVTPSALINGYVRTSGIGEFGGSSLTASDIWNHSTRSLNIPVSVSGLVSLDSSTQTIINNLDSRITSARAGYLDNLNIGGLVATSGQSDLLLTRLTSGRATNLDNLDTTISSRATDATVWTNGTRTLTSPVSVSGGIVDLVTTTTNVTNTVPANLVTWLGQTPSGLINGYVRTSGIGEFGGSSLTAADIWTYTTRALNTSVTVSGINDGLLTTAKFGAGAIDSTIFAQTAADRAWSTVSRSLTSPVSVSGLVSLDSASQIKLDGLVNNSGFINTVNTNVLTRATDAGVWTNGTRSLSVAVSVSGTPGVNVVQWNAVTASGTGSPNVNLMAWRNQHPLDLIAGYVRTSGINEFSGASLTAADVWTYSTRNLNVPVSVSGFVSLDSATQIKIDGLANNSGFINTVNTNVLTRATDAGVWANGTRSLTTPVSVSGGIINSLTSPVSTSGGNISLVTTTTNVTNTVGANLLTWLGSTPLSLNAGYVRSSGINEFSGASLTAGDVWTYATRSLNVPVSVSGTVDLSSATETQIDNIDSRLTSTRAGYLDNLAVGFIASSGQAETLISRLTAQRATNLDFLDASIASRATNSGVWLNSTRSLVSPVSTSGGLIDTVTNVTGTVGANLLTWLGVTPSALINGYVRTSGISEFSGASLTAGDIWTYSTRSLNTPVSVSGLVSLDTSSQIKLDGLVNNSGFINTVNTNVLTRATDAGVWTNGTRSLTNPVSTSGGTINNVTTTIDSNLVTWKGSTPLDLIQGYVRTSGINENSGSALTAGDVWSYVSRSLTTPVSVSGLVSLDANTQIKIDGLAANSGFINVVNANVLTRSTDAGVWTNGTRSLTTAVSVSGGTVTNTTNVTNTVGANLLTWLGVTPSALINGYVRTSGISEFSGSSLSAADVWAYSTRGLNVPVSSSGGTINNITNTVDSNLVTWKGSTPLDLIQGYVRTSGIQEYGAGGSLTAADVWTYATRSLNTAVSVSGGIVNTLTTPVSVSGGTVTNATNVTNTVNSNLLTWLGETPAALITGYVRTSGINEYGASSLTASDIWSFGNRSVTSPVSVSGLVSLDANTQIKIDGLAANSGFINTVNTNVLTRATDAGVWSNGTRSLTSPVSTSGGNITLVTTTTNLTNTANANLVTWLGDTPSGLINGYVQSSGIGEFGGGSSLTAGDIWTYSTRSLNTGVSVSGLVSLDSASQIKLDGLVNNSGFINIVNTNVLSRATDAGVWGNSTRSLTTAVSTSGGIVNTITNQVVASGLTNTRATYLDNLSPTFIANSGQVEILLERVTSTRAANLDNLDVTVSTRSTPATNWAYSTRGLTEAVTVSGLLDSVINATGSGVWTSISRSLTTPVSTSGTVVLANATHTGAVIPTVTTVTNGVTLSTDIYFADIQVTKDDANSRDEYTVSWFKNGVPVTAGITSATLQVVKRSDGTDLVSPTSMTEIGSIGVYKLDATLGNRITAGEAVLAVASATIDAGSRIHRKILTRDSTS